MSNKEPAREIPASDNQPTYQKPQTTLFLLKAEDIQSGTNVLHESQGAGFLGS